jgi:hypothetical protein
MASKQQIIAEVYDANGAPAQFRELRVETESTNEAGDRVLKGLASSNYYPEAENRYTFKYALKRPDASIWLVLVDDLGETKKRITPGKRQLVLRSEVGAEAGAESTRAAKIKYEYNTYNVGDVDMSKQVIKGSPGANLAGRDLTVRQVNAFNRDSYNAIKDRHGEEVAKAFDTVGKVVDKSKSPTAKKVFRDLSEEAKKAKPSKPKLKSFWSDLVKLAPAAAKVGTAVAKVTGMFSS